jgi:hypothetical protein
MNQLVKLAKTLKKKNIPKRWKASSSTVESESMQPEKKVKTKKEAELTETDYIIANLTEEQKAIYEKYKKLIKEKNVQCEDQSLIVRSLKTKQYFCIDI